ncbi:MAG: hypothetical protein ACH346_01565 [Chthoniobacterales bacterium]
MTTSQTLTCKPRCSCARFWTTLGMLVLFLCAVIVMLRWNPEPLEEDAERALLRTKNLSDLQKVNTELLGSYGWIKQSHGILHVPITRAMELEVPTLNAIKPHAASPIAPIDLLPTPAGMPATPAAASVSALATSISPAAKN